MCHRKRLHDPHPPWSKLALYINISTLVKLVDGDTSTTLKTNAKAASSIHRLKKLCELCG